MSTKNLFIITIIFAFLVSIFWSFLVYNYMENNLNSPYKIENIGNFSKNWSSNQVNLDLKEIQTNVKSIATKVNPSVVNIIISKDIRTYRTDPFGFFQEPSWTIKRTVWWWSWFFVTKNWLILTNKHVVSDTNASYTIITSNNDEFEWKVLALDPTNDLALIKAFKNGKEISGITPVNLIEDNKSVQVWDFIVAIWNALAEFQNTVTFWVVSWLWRSIEAWDQIWWSIEQLSGLIQTDAAINPWNSGGPLVDLNWNVIWISTAVAQWANWLWFAIPLSINEVNYILNSYEKYWEIKRPFLWIKYIPINKGVMDTFSLKSEYGDYIPNEAWNLIVNWPADKAWLEPGNIILEADWTILKNWITIKDVIKNKFPWYKIKLKVLRNDWKTDFIDLVLGEN